MKIKKIFLILILVLSIFPTSKIFAQGNNITNSGVVKLVEDKTPKFVKNIVAKTINTIEGFRIATGNLFFDMRNQTRVELELIPSPQPNTNIENEETFKVDTQASFDQVVKETKNGIFLKPFKYAELFLLTLVIIYFKNVFLFYIGSLIFIFLLFRMLTKQ